MTLYACCHFDVAMAILFISIGRMPFLAPTIDNADPLFALVIKPGSYFFNVFFSKIHCNFVLQETLDENCCMSAL